MLNAKRRSSGLALRRARGFSLIELMIAVVIGLLVMAGAMTLVVAINQANASTIQSARLTQELRTTLEVVAGELRRARRVDDSIGQIGIVGAYQAMTPPQTYPVATDSISTPTTTPTNSCILYGYQGTESNGATGFDTTRTGNNFRSIYLAVNSGVGSVVLVANATAANVTCSATPTVTLSSNQVDITALTFTPTAPSTNVNDGAISITITGRPQFRSGLSYGYNGITRTLTQVVIVRPVRSGT